MQEGGCSSQGPLLSQWGCETVTQSWSRAKGMDRESLPEVVAAKNPANVDCWRGGQPFLWHYGFLQTAFAFPSALRKYAGNVFLIEKACVEFQVTMGKDIAPGHRGVARGQKRLRRSELRTQQRSEDSPTPQHSYPGSSSVT